MTVLLFASRKGGTGKTTNAVQLAHARAAQGRKVLIVDMDQQASAVLWHSQRPLNAVKIHCMSQIGPESGARIQDFMRDYDDIVIDTRGTEVRNKEMRQAMLIADILIAPIKTSLFDSVTTIDMAETVDEAKDVNEKLKAFILLNDVSTHAHSTRDADIRAELNDLPAFSGVLKTQVYHRAIYELVAEKGMAVAEFAKGVRTKIACDEIAALANEVWAAA